MKKLLLVMTLGLVVFIALNRQRLYLWDPLARVTADGVKIDGAKAMINANNDVLLFVPAGTEAAKRITLVQRWNLMPGTPLAELRCLSGMACLEDADQATTTAIAPGARGRRTPFEGVTMTNRRVEFVDADGALIEVVLR